MPSKHSSIIRALCWLMLLPVVVLLPCNLRSRSCSAETGHFGSYQHINSVRGAEQLDCCPWCPFLSVHYLLQSVSVLCSVLFIWGGDSWVCGVMYKLTYWKVYFFVCVWFSEVRRIKLLTPWIWTHSRKDSKQPCQSFNPRYRHTDMHLSYYGYTGTFDSHDCCIIYMYIDISDV